MRKFAVAFSLLFATLSAFAGLSSSPAEIVVACSTPDKVIEAVYNPPTQVSPFKIYSATNREVLGEGVFTKSGHYAEDGFLKYTMIGFEGEAGILAVAFDDPAFSSFEELLPGQTYAGKADAFVQYGPGQNDYLDGSTLECEIRVGQ